MQDIPLLNRTSGNIEMIFEIIMDYVDIFLQQKTHGVLNMLWHFEVLTRFGSIEKGLRFYDELLAQLSQKNCSFLTLQEIKKAWFNHIDTVFIQ